MTRGTLLLAVALTSALAGCGEATGGSADGSADPGRPAASPTAHLPADGPVRAVATVLDPGDGPVLCLGDMAYSSPPQCDGPTVAGWDWAEHPEHESASGARWGSFALAGTWDGTTFTPTEARPATQDDWPHSDNSLPDTPCAEPDGGWVVVDPATTNQAARSAVTQAAEKLPDYGLLWGDQSINPRWQDFLDGNSSPEVEQALNDPALTIINVGVTADPTGAETALRRVWGGPLCVYQLINTQQRLREVAEKLQDLPGGLGAQFGTVSNRVELRVIYDDESIQSWVDQEYGTDVVEVTSAFTPAT